VLITGETGVGKELIAETLHTSSSRREGPFLAVNCAAIPSELLEAELFGIESGVATGVTVRKGKFQLAEGALNNLEMDCRVSFEACAWVPLAEWVSGTALSSIDGREIEGERMLALAGVHASGTWIATSLTQ